MYDQVERGLRYDDEWLKNHKAGCDSSRSGCYDDLSTLTTNAGLQPLITGNIGKVWDGRNGLVRCAYSVLE